MQQGAHSLEKAGKSGIFRKLKKKAPKSNVHLKLVFPFQTDILPSIIGQARLESRCHAKNHVVSA